MRSPEWSERKSRVNEPERCRGHATKGCITRDGKRKDKRDGPRKAPSRDGGRKSGENCGKETLRRIGSLNHLGERKLGACFPNIAPPSRHPSSDILVAVSSTARAEYRMRVHTYLSRARNSGETQRNRMYASSRSFLSIANRPIFSIFKDALVPRICYLSTSSFVPAFPCPTCLSVFALGRSGATCVHEHFNLFFFIRPHYLRRYTRLHDIVN